MLWTALRSPLEPKKFRLEQLSWERGAVDLDEWHPPSHGRLRERPGHKLLARAGLALNEHGYIRVRQAFHQRRQFGHRATGAEQYCVPGLGAWFLSTCVSPSRRDRGHGRGR